MTPLLLALWAFVLVNPGPAWVRRWRFLHRIPAAALVLWQAGTVSALLATIGAGAMLGWWWWREPPGHWAWSALLVLGVLFSLNVVARLVWTLVRVAALTNRRRARHRAAVDLVARAGVDDSALRVLVEERPLAYCLPGVRRSRVVLSSGTLASLAPAEVEAVLAHERAHLRQRHDLVLDFFTALHQAFPRGVRSDAALTEGRVLVEMLADDAALRRSGEVPVARALVAMAGSPVPGEALGLGEFEVLMRVRRLGVTPPRWLGPAVLALAAALVVAPVLVLAVGIAV